jgi:hypothetical protein
MIAEKKTWKTPQLRVLVRSRPEEAVLAGCKFGSNTNGPYDARCKKKASLDNCSTPAKS